MLQTAANGENFGTQFADLVAAQGSLPVIQPLASFLEKSAYGSDLRMAVKISRPALKADIAHFLNVTHGRHPGIVDHAATKIVEQEAREWLVQAIDGFALERKFLNQLTVAAGPVHRHIGQDRVNTVVEGQSRSITMLATSDRKGTAAGAAVAFVLDWRTTRPLLERVAIALGIEAPPCTLPDHRSSMALISDLAVSPVVQRAIIFGCDQMLAQQKGLWQLIAARHQAILAE
jgi:hypothetical protein